ncbi:MAG TPA: hypothetical protein VG755_40420 [Nannocystaceae bacterium]|nr:hypothetical protein [Nannocystaceae bacterium]
MNRRFLRSLHEQHVEEIAILYERRRGLLDDVEIGLHDLVSIEDRIEAHLDALVVGADPALKLCAELSLGGEPGERFVAIALLLRQKRRDLLEAALPTFEESDAPAEAAADDEDDFAGMPGLEELDQIERGPITEDDPAFGAEDDDAAPEHEAPAADEAPSEAAAELTLADALTDALRFEATPDWQPVYERVIAGGLPVARNAFVAAAAARGLTLGPAIVATAQRSEPATLAPLLWALGRLRERTAATLLSEHARAMDGALAPIATLALLRSGDPSVVEHVARLAPSHPWACSLLAIAGGPAHAAIVQGCLARAQVTAVEIGAAGLFGDVTVVPRLIELLGKGVHAATTAQALHLITGAAVGEKVIVEVKDPEPLANGQPDPRDRVEITRLAEDAAKWNAWWSARRSAFEPRRRYRLGQLASPVSLGQTLHQFVLRRWLRQLAAEEIGVRYKPRHDLDVDMLVRTQLTAMAELSGIHQGDPIVSHADGAWLFTRQQQR